MKLRKTVKIFIKIPLIFDIEKWLWQSELRYFWPSKRKRTQGLEFFYTNQVGSGAKLIHPWTQLCSAVQLRSRYYTVYFVVIGAGSEMQILSWGLHGCCSTAKLKNIVRVCKCLSNVCKAKNRFRMKNVCFYILMPVFHFIITLDYLIYF